MDQRLNEIDKNERDLGVLEEIIAGVPVSRSLNNKIAQGRQKEGTREVIGAHSADILNYPREYQILDNYTNVNGTIVAHIRIRIIDPNTGLETWSKATKRTLAPKTWTYPDLEEATSIVGKPFNYIYTRKRDGSRLYRARVNGIEWEVWRDKDGYVTSSYPTGN